MNAKISFQQREKKLYNKIACQMEILEVKMQCVKQKFSCLGSRADMTMKDFKRSNEVKIEIEIFPT
jgi:hypothetical protein